MIVKKLELVNFQVIKEFNADFEGNVYFITGDNELGKSTILKAIGALLTGNRDAVLRNGESKGSAKMIVGDDGEEYEVELKFTKANPRGTLSIKSKTTGMKSDNVSMLQKIFGYTDFDAVEFSRWSETAEGRRKQIEVVKSLLPEDVRKHIADIDEKVAVLKSERTGVNRDAKTFASIANESGKGLTPEDIKKYVKPIDISDLLNEQNQNAKLIEKAKGVRKRLEERKTKLQLIPQRIETEETKLFEKHKKIDADLSKITQEAETIIKQQQDRLAKAKEDAKFQRENAIKQKDDAIAGIKAEKDELETKISQAEKWIANYESINPEKCNTEEQLRKSEEYNKMCSKVSDYLSKKKQADDKKQQAEKMDEDIANLSSERGKLISTSKLPVAGLSFTDEGLELNGVPFVAGKVSDSQIMEVAAKLIIASNPTVKVFRIARGESLGEKKLQAILDLAKKEGYQGFIESVVRGQQDLIIEEYEEADK
jgi:DNA repair exonuclease SbcCD ATPase subunit